MSLSKSKKVAAIISDAGGKIVGRTRLQKVAYLLHVVGLESDFSFSYKHYGPFSEELAASARLGHLLKDLNETEEPTEWGGSYSIYKVDMPFGIVQNNPRNEFAKAAAEADSVLLELAATAIFLKKEGAIDPWAETERRKPEKANNGRLDKAKALLTSLSRIDVPVKLPVI